MGLVANAVGGYSIGELERETGFEPAISCMASKRSTAELLPRGGEGRDRTDIPGFSDPCRDQLGYLARCSISV